MTKPTGTRRPIQYPLDRSADIESDTPLVPIIDNSTIDGFPIDPDERINIILNMSLNEYVALATCIDVGRDIAYGDNSIYLWWIWVRSVISMTICDDVTSCIETNEGTQNAISNIISGIGNGGIPSGGSSGGGASAIINITNNTTNILAGSSGCTDDNMYAVATRIAELAFEAVGQVYEAIDLAISPTELMAEVGDNAPAVATGAPSTVADWYIWIQDTAQDAWLVYDTAQERIDVACDLFCIMKDNGCSLTFDDIATYFWDSAGTPIEASSLEVLMTFMAGQILAEPIGRISLAFVFATLAVGAKFADIENVGLFLTVIAAYVDETNNNWTLECDPCGVVPLLEVGLVGCAGLAPALGTVTKVSDFVYDVTTALNGGTDKRVLIVRDDGGKFRITSATLLIGLNTTFRAVCEDDVVTLINSGLPPIGVIGNTIALTCPNTNSPTTYRITVEFL